MEKDERERLLILIDHWINHNQEHIAQYLSWAQKMEEADLKDVADRLKQASDLISQANREFSAARGALAGA
jgi:D-serine dehydratase